MHVPDAAIGGESADSAILNEIARFVVIGKARGHPSISLPLTAIPPLRSALAKRAVISARPKSFVQVPGVREFRLFERTNQLRFR